MAIISPLEPRVTKPDKTVNRSFRISEKAYKALEEGALKRKVSLNTFVNQLFLEYAEFDRYAIKVHPFNLPGPLLRMILDTVPEEKITSIAKSWSNNVLFKQQILDMTGSYTREGVIQAMKNVANHQGFEYSDIIDQNGKRSLTIIHHLGRNWSLFGAISAETILHSMGSGPIKYEVSEDSVMVEWASSQSSAK